MMLDDSARERYQRQIIIPEIGESGQEVLARKRVLIVGCGGLGTPCAAYLAGAGVGHLTLVDADSVALSNLPRQYMYTVDEIDQMKAPSMAKKLSRNNPGVEVVPMTVKITDDNAADLVRGFDVAVSCVDNLETRYSLNRACVSAGIPMVEAAVTGFSGIVTVVMPGKGPCYQCIFPKKPVAVKKPVPVVGPAPGVAGTIQASETLKLLLGIGDPLVGRMILFDLLASRFDTVKVERNPECPVCQHLAYT